MSIFNFFRPKAPAQAPQKITQPQTTEMPWHTLSQSNIDIKRYFHNERGFQCYTTWFAHWGGWISAGHCVTEALDHTPNFVTQDCTSWPDGLDAAIAGCALPRSKPPSPKVGQSVIMQGYPAGCRTMETRKGVVYFKRGAGQWITHIKEPDEPVVTGMSGGPVIDAETGEPIGIIITRNSPADLNNDRDPDESADFISLTAVWDALNKR